MLSINAVGVALGLWRTYSMQDLARERYTVVFHVLST